MTRKDQKRLVRELLRGLHKRMMRDLSNVPKEWDGRELRQWMQDLVAENINYLHLPRDHKRAYNNARITHNL